MIVVKIELHGAVTGKVTEIGRLLIGNDGSEAAQGRGNYDVKVLRKRARTLVAIPAFHEWHTEPVTRTGRVENYPSRSYNVWRLVTKALKSAFPEEA